MRVLPAIALWFAAAAAGEPLTETSLTFDGLNNGEQVLEFYNGGFGSQGSGPGPDFGVSFTGVQASSNEIAFGPSGLIPTTAVMNLAAPWSEAISFYFGGSATVRFYSEPNLGGILVAAYAISPDDYFPFGAVPGMFRSAQFASNGGLYVDSVTFGAFVVPEPSTFALLGIGAAALAAARLRRRAG